MSALSARPGASAAQLKKDTISPLGLAALAIGITSPAMGLFALWGTMEVSTGPVTPLVFLSAMVVTLPTGISYAVLNSRCPSTGAASTWLWCSVSPTVGFMAGLWMTTYFFMATVSSPVLFAMFFADFLKTIHAPLSHVAALSLGVVISSIPVALLSLQGAEASVKTTMRLMFLESCVVLALSGTILFTKAGEVGGITLVPFNPLSATHGFVGFWSATVVGVLGFCGFDVVSTAAEEANAPRTHLPRAIFITLLGMGLFWAINAWVFTLGLPLDRVIAYTEAGMPAVTAVAERYWGLGSLTIDIVAFTGVTAVYLSCVQGSSRIIFSLSRQGLLPSVLSQLVGERRVPRNSVLLVLLSAVLFDLITLGILRNGLETFNWWAFGLVFFATLTFIAVNFSNAVYFFRFVRGDFNVLTNLVVPVVGVLVNAYLLYAAFFVALWSSNLPIGRSIVIACVGILAIQILSVIYMRVRSAELFEQSLLIS